MPVEVSIPDGEVVVSQSNYVVEIGDGPRYQVDAVSGIVDAPAFAGPYVATPTRETQVFPAANRLMSEDFIVNPIPSNYGLVTWDGSVITVS